MSEFNSKHNRAVWFDIPVADLDRAAGFYRAVLNLAVPKHQMGEMALCVIDHTDGNGGCLVPHNGYTGSTGGVLVYLNVDGRIRAALSQVERHGGKIIEPFHAIGPHGFRALILDSEGNRLALHSNRDA